MNFNFSKYYLLSNVFGNKLGLKKNTILSQKLQVDYSIVSPVKGSLSSGSALDILW